MKTSKIIFNMLAAASLTLAGSAYADEATKEGYVTDSRGNVVKNNYNECWRTGFWTPAMAIKECDPDLIKKVASAPAPKTSAPEPVTAAPASKPVAVAAPPKPRKTTFATDSSADALFGFNKSAVTPAGQQALDKFAADLKNASFDVITVTGHTDRIGSKKYNLKLSAQRAEAVKAYLVKSANVPADKIEARGVNGDNPVTKPGECKGNKATKKLIACLAPDRRVEVEVSTTQTSK
ncbi:MAG: OmpA family protein [Sulfuricellaceae bacterium]